MLQDQWFFLMKGYSLTIITFESSLTIIMEPDKMKNSTLKKA